MTDNDFSNKKIKNKGPATSTTNTTRVIIVSSKSSFVFSLYNKLLYFNSLSTCPSWGKKPKMTVIY